MKKMYKATLLFALVCLFLGSLPAHAEPSIEEIYQKVESLNPGLSDYSAAINMNVKAKWMFIPYSPKLAGHFYHKAPDKNKLVLEEAPSFIKDQPNAFGFNLPDLKQYSGKVNGTVDYQGRKVWDLYLFPKDSGKSVMNVEIYVDCENYTVPYQVTNYKDNGCLSITANYTKADDKYWVFKSMHGTFSFPKVKVNATADATYTDYKFNQGLTDAFFQTKK